MTVTLHLYATLAKYLPESAQDKSVCLSLAPGQTVKDALAALQVPPEKVKLIFVNGVHARFDTELSPGDRVGAFPPVGGG